jgi:hypothetical protein
MTKVTKRPDWSGEPMDKTRPAAKRNKTHQPQLLQNVAITPVHLWMLTCLRNSGPREAGKF